MDQLTCRLVLLVAALWSCAEAFGEPVVKETHEGGTSVISITATDGDETVYRIDLSQRHSPAIENTDLLKKWNSYRFGAFVCFNTNQFSGSEHCKITDPKMLAKQIKLGYDRGAANVLLATAPDHTGRMRPDDVEQLRRAGKLLREGE